LTALSTTLVVAAITIVLWFGAHQVLSKEMTGGELVQFLLFAVYAGVAAASLSEMWSEVQRAAGAMERLVELQEATPAIVAPPNARAASGNQSRTRTFRERAFQLPVTTRDPRARRFFDRYRTGGDRRLRRPFRRW
jgi:ATP-binding cassette subfamily B protein